MVKCAKFWRAFRADESGATAIEYGLILAGICVAIVAAVNTVGSSIGPIFTDVIAPALG